ncbi:MAG TPA: MFS transporter [Burkholderiales bacterium]|nr:MFS transporter [Burkholderiales bacterium]
MEPLSVARGWPRDYFSFAIALQNLCWGLSQPIAGMFADRYGPRVVLLFGGVLYAGGTALMSIAADPVMLYVSGGVLVGFGMGAASYITVLAAFSQIMPADVRSWALGLATAAGSLGQFLIVPIGQAVMTATDWQTAAIALAASIAAIPFLALALQRPARAHRAGAGVPLSVAVARALGNRDFVLLASGFFVCGFQLAFITVHFPAYLADHGINPTVAAWSIGLIGLLNIAGGYVAGVLGARHSRKNLLTLIYLGRGLAIAAFLLMPLSTPSVLLFGAALGVLWLATVPLTSGVVGAIFGTQYIATLFGLVFLSHQVGSFFGVWLGGALYERTGSYDLIWWMTVALSLIAAALNWPIRERPLVLKPLAAA